MVELKNKGESVTTAESKDMLPLLAGAARIDTTPPLGTRINGDFITHYATAIHDALYSKALVLKQDQTLVAFVVVDICVMSKDFLDSVKAGITQSTGISASHQMISSTHTHAAGSVADVHLGSVDPAYVQKLPGLILASVQDAIQNLRPARIAFGTVQAPEHLLCRRYEMHPDYTAFNPVTGQPDTIKTNPFGAENNILKAVAPTDPELGYLAVKGLDDRWIGLLANYSLHYVGDWENGTISADYFGVFSEELRRKLAADEDFVGIMSNGTSGDVNIWDFLRPDRYPTAHFAKSKLIGSDLADKVAQSIHALDWQSAPLLKAAMEIVRVPVTKPTAAELEAAARLVAQAHYETIVPDEAGLRQIYAREQLLLHETADFRECPVQVIRIGEGMIGGLAGEFFSETGLYLKENAVAKHYFTISMANGNVGYVPPSGEIANGGYETWRCRYSCLVAGAEQVIRAQLLAVAAQLRISAS
nr:neutral/alkaline non-lysosomal ceramidase N-terminal domain-containing protein [uncultured Dyadobacter sp.]